MFTLLYIDDEPGLLEIGRIYLENTGDFSVTTALSGKAGLDALGQHDFDAIVADYQMPEMDGIELLKNVRQSFGNIPFILFTGRGREEVVIEAINNGVDFYLQKGGDPTAQFAELAHKIRQAVSRRRAEIGLSDSEKRFRELADLLPQGIYEADKEGRMVYVNRIALEMSGYTAEDIEKGLDAMAVIAPRDRQRAATLFRQMVETGSRSQGSAEYLALQKDGSTFPVSIFSSPIVKDGRITGIRGVMIDITEQKKAADELQAANEQLVATSEELKVQYDELAQSEAQIRLSEARLTYMLGFYEYAQKSERELLEYAIEGAGIVTGSSLGYLAFLNEDESELAMYAWSKAAMAECSMREKPIIYRTEKTGLWGEAVRQRRPVITNDYAAPNPAKKGYPEGHPHIIRHMNVPVTDEGRIVLVAGVANKQSDYTENDVNELLLLMQGLWTIIKRKRLQEEQKAAYEQLAAAGEELKAQYDELAKSGERIRESEERFKTLFERSAEAQLLLDGTGRVTDCNAAFLTLFALPDKQEILGHSPEEFAPEFQPDGVRSSIRGDEIFARVMEEGMVQYEWAHLEHDAERTPILTEVICTLIQIAGQPVIHASIRDITDRKQTEKALRESEEKYRGVIENLQDVFYRADVAGNITMASPSATEVFEYGSVDEVIGLNLARDIYLDPKNREDFLTAIRKTGSVKNFEAILKKKDGSPVIVSTSAHYYRDPEGNILGVEGIAKDITEWKHTEEALRESEAKFRAVIEQSFQFIGLMDTDGTLIEANRSALEFAGITESDVINRPFWETPWWSHSPELQEKLKDAVRRAASGETVRFEATHPAADGHLAYVDFSLKPVVDPSGRILYLIPEGRDITERKRAEEALRESEEKYRTLVESSFDGIAIHQDGILVYVNQTAARLLGSDDPAVFIGKPAIDFAAPAFRKQIAERVQQAPEKELELIHEQFLRLDGTPIDVDVTTTPTTWQGRAAAYVTFRDITAQIRAEEALRESEEKYRTILDTTREWIWDMDLDGWHTYSNPAVESLLGYTPEEFMGFSAFDLMHPEDRERIEKIFTLSVRERKGWRNVIVRWRHKDGTYRFLESNATTILNERGELTGFRGADRDITESKQAEEALRESEERFRALVETTSDFIWEVDAAGKYTYVSPQVRYILGYEPEELFGKTPFEIMPPDEATRVAAEFRRCVDSQLPIVALENKAMKKDGSVVILETSGVVWTAEDGSYLGYRGIDRDITMRKHAEEALKESEARLSSILHGSPILQFVIDRNHRVISWNKALEEYSGFRAADMIGTDQQWRAFYANKRPVLADLLIDGNTDAITRLYAGKLRKSRYVEEAYEATDFFPHMGSSGIWLSFTAAPIRDVQGAIIGAVETLEDVTERINAENALRESDKWTRTILNTAQAGIVLVDANTHRIVDANRKALELIGLDQDSVIGTVCHRFICPAEEGKCPVTDLGQEVNTSERVLLTASGKKIPVLKTVVRLSMGGREILVESFVDISEQKRSEDAIREANRKLNLLNSITRHDIRNQLMVAQGYTKLATFSKPEPVVADFLNKITAAVQTIQRQIEFTKEYQELGVHAPAWFMIRNVISTVMPDKMAVRNTCNAVEIFADPMIDKVFYNLFDNAVKYGERVTTIAIGCEETDRGLVITFADNGVGIPVGEKQKIFEKGYGRNTGFGLFLVREILAITGITIEETGTEGKGAVFEITVPRGAYRKPE